MHMYVTGSKDERGITAWQAPKTDPDSIDPELYDEGYEVYLPLLPRRILELSFMKYVPFLPHLKKDK